MPFPERNFCTTISSITTSFGMFEGVVGVFCGNLAAISFRCAYLLPFITPPAKAIPREARNDRKRPRGHTRGHL
eukprot:3967752-Amphidinium_carterae.1